MSLNFAIRQAQSSDIPTIAAVHRDSVTALCSSHYSAAQLDAWFQDRPPDMYVKAVRENRIWIAAETQDVLGFLEIRTGEIEKLFVCARSAHRGIGSALLRFGVDRVRDTFSGTIAALALLNARTFYERHGFTKVGDSAILRGPSQIAIAVARMEFRAPSMHNAA